ncbi:MAG: hypothetical protein EOM24_15610 [Chloroflexia bacterium]|nr:hypothetical protein [Chloroflexia bacterium]
MNFVVFGQTRTGSSLLVDTLRTHPQVQCDVNSGEILHSNHWHRGIKRYFRSLMRHFSELYVLWKASRSARPVYGFKLLYHQVATPRRLIATLHRSGWLVIHIQRRQLFDLALSQQIAQLTNHYGAYQSTGQSNNATIEVSGNAFIRQMQRCIDIRHGELLALAGIPHISVVYETDMLDEAERNRICGTIFEALRIEPLPVFAPRERSWNRPYAELVANYAELVAMTETDEGLALQAAWDSTF